MKDFSKPANLSISKIACEHCILEKLTPNYEDIPDDFKQQGHPWVEWQQVWAEFGLKLKDMPVIKKGISEISAVRHLGMVQHSNTLTDAHREAAVAYLASLWFEPL